MTDSGLEQPREEITRRLEEFCRDRGYVLSDNKGLIIEDLVRRYHLLGDFYCPCQVENEPDTVCVCSAARNGLIEEQGACFCGLVLACQEEQPISEENE